MARIWRGRCRPGCRRAQWHVLARRADHLGVDAIAAARRQWCHVDGKLGLDLGEVALGLEPGSVALAAARVVVGLDVDLDGVLVDLVVAVHEIDEALAGLVGHVRHTARDKHNQGLIKK